MVIVIKKSKCEFCHEFAAKCKIDGILSTKPHNNERTKIYMHKTSTNCVGLYYVVL